MNVKAVVLAGGKGTRMKSDMPKVLSSICGDSLINHVLKNLNEAGVSDIAVVTGYKSEEVEKNVGSNVLFYHQSEQLGTAHAVACAKNFFKDTDDAVMVLCGDAPLIDSETITGLINYFNSNSLDLCVLSALLPEGANYGRIVRQNGRFTKIVEKKDASFEELSICEVNSGAMIFSSASLLDALEHILSSGTNNAQGEYYLTDSVEYLLGSGKNADAFVSPSPNAVMGANDRYELSLCEAAMRHEINKKLMLSGVTLIDPSCTYIDRSVQIDEGTVIYPGTIIKGCTQMGKNNIIYSSRIEGCQIGDGNTIDNCVIELSQIGNNTNLGPYTHIRKGTFLSDHTKVGSFSETKNTALGEGSKIPHLSYVGDASVGKNVNFGCGCVTANYDGVNKHRTEVGDNSFIGCNVNLIAPISVGNNTFIAAGSTVSRNVKDDTFVIERNKLREHEVKKLKK